MGVLQTVSRHWENCTSLGTWLEDGKLPNYTGSVEEIFQRLSTTLIRGLSPEQIDRRIKEYGKNVLSPPETYRIKQIFGY